MTAGVPQVNVDASALGPELARDTFAAMVRDIFDVAPIDPDPAQTVAVEAWHLGTMMVGTFAGPPMRFVRDSARIVRTGLDQILVQLYTHGGFDGTAGELPIRVAPGDICVFDLVDTIATRTSAFANISVLVPRGALRGGIEDLSLLHGMVIDGTTPLAAMLGDHLRSVATHIGALRDQETAYAAAATQSLIAATLAACAIGRTPPRAVGAHASPLRRACDYIDAHIGDPTLEVDRIAQALGCSRAALFRIFAGEHGVVRYVRRRRLDGAARDLADPIHVRRIGEIARRWGFSSDTVFSRAFRDTFGVSPRLARRNPALLADPPRPGDGGATERRFTEWIRSLRNVTPGQ